MKDTHRSPYAGRWYPAGRSELERLLDRCWTESERRVASVQPGGVAWILPHAGPEYSGTVAAAVARAVAEARPVRVVVIGFPHRGGLRGCAWPDCAAIETPLGAVAIDREWLSALPFAAAPESALCDHSVEIQLPFLQRAAPDARIALLYAGWMNDDERRAAADALAAAWQPGTLLLASSDFTHYGRDFGFQPFPPGGDTQERIAALDREVMRSAATLDSAFVLETLDRSGATVCGRAPIGLLLDSLVRAHGDAVWQLELDYMTSAEKTGEREHSVSYAALGYYPRAAFDLDRADRLALLDAAEASVLQWRDTHVRRAIPAAGSRALQAHRGVFVTMRHEGELRGCIGNPAGVAPLATAVPELALSAALDDPRFSHGRDQPVPLEIEISVLTPFRQVRTADAVVAGRHGVHLDHHGRRSLLLPQVATEHGWDRDDLLSALARKGRHAPHAWREPGAQLSVFEAQVFSRETEAG